MGGVGGGRPGNGAKSGASACRRFAPRLAPRCRTNPDTVTVPVRFCCTAPVPPTHRYRTGAVMVLYPPCTSTALALYWSFAGDMRERDPCILAPMPSQYQHSGQNANAAPMQYQRNATTAPTQRQDSPESAPRTRCTACYGTPDRANVGAAGVGMPQRHPPDWSSRRRRTACPRPRRR